MSDFKSISSKLLELILESGCFIQSDDWVDMDTIWEDPKSLNKFSDVLSAYLSAYKKKNDFNKIVVPIKIYGPLGLLPVIAVCSTKLGIPFIVWKEWGKPATGEFIIYGSPADGDKLLILHDIIVYGATIIRSVVDLKSRIKDKKNCRIVGILSILERETEGTNIITRETKLPTNNILCWSDLRKEDSSLEE